MRLIAILLFESLLILANPLDKKQSEEWMESNKINSEEIRMRNKSREVLVDNCPVVCEDLSGTKYCCVEDSDCCDKTCCTENKQCCRRFNPAEQLTGDVHGNEADSKKPLEEIIPDQVIVWALGIGGQGDCTYIICPNNDMVIIDMGSSNTSPYGLNKTEIQTSLVNYLQTYPFSKFRIIITYPDKYHYNYFQDVLTGLESSVEYFILGGDFYKYTDGEFMSWLSINFINRIFSINGGSTCYGNEDCKIVPFGKSSPVMTPNFCNNNLVKFTILAANFGITKTSKMSAVIKVQYGSISILFPGDFTSYYAQLSIISRYNNTGELQATIYKMVHHGTDGNDLIFLDEIKPKAAFVSQESPTSSNDAAPRCTVIRDLINVGIQNHSSTGEQIICGNICQKPTQHFDWNYQIYETCRSQCQSIRIQFNQSHYEFDYRLGLPLPPPDKASSEEFW